MKYGIKGVSMQDMAHKLGISKKALYDQFENKQDLVNAVINYDFDFVTENLDQIERISTNAIDELLKVGEFVVKRFGQCNPCMMFDLQKYYSKSWSIFTQRKMTFINSHILTNLNRGQQEGLYRMDFDKEVIARIYLSKIDLFFDEQMFPAHQFNFGQLHTEYMVYHLRGIASKKGHDIVDISLSLKNMNS